MPLLSLPNEILGELVQHLRQAELCSFVRVNRQLYFGFHEHLLRRNVRCEKGTALTWAVMKDRAPLTRKLVQLGAEVNRQLDFQIHEYLRPTLLHVAAAMGNLPMVKLLFELGADLNMRDDGGRAPHYWALYTGNEEMIREFSRRTENLSQFIVDELLMQTPLHLAAWLWQTDMVRHFVEIGLDINAKDKSGMTPLDLAKRALSDDYWSRICHAQDGLGARTRTLFLALGEDPVAANWGLACKPCGRERCECSRRGLGDEPDSHGVRTPKSRCDTNAALPPSVPSATLAVPPLASLTVATDATPEPPNGPRSARGVQNLETGASSRVDEIDTSASRPESRNRFPQQINESLDHARNQMRKAWTRLRKGKREEGGSVV